LLNRYLYVAEDSSEFLEDQSVKTTEQDRFTSFCNTLRGFEEFILNPQGIIISSNLEAVNITGYEEWEVIGKHFSLFYPKQDAVLGRTDDDLRAALENGKVFYSGSFVRKKGLSFMGKIRISIFKDQEGNFSGYRVVLKDTTHNALYNYRVKRVRDEYLNLFNNSFIGIYKFRLSDFRILLLNEKAKEMLSIQNLDEIDFSELFSDPDQFQKFSETLAEKNSIENWETEVQHKGIWVSISCKSFPQLGFVEGVVIDVTEKKKQMAELERLNLEIDKFIYHSSHDMRAPLTTILGLTHLVRLESPPMAVVQYNDMIQTQVNHLDNLLKSLVNITFNKGESTFEFIDFEKELEVILRDFRHNYQQVRVETIFNGNNLLYSDPARIHIILKNLISNAFRFHNPKAETPFVKIHISLLNTQTVIQVEDNGSGIDDEAIENIFTMFYKGEHGTTGLGLYIVKSMVDKLGGAIQVRSKRWFGSVFTITLPNIQHNPITLTHTRMQNL
jgi:PAS domain S-box-containing protein